MYVSGDITKFVGEKQGRPDIRLIPYDDFYAFLENNRDFDKGKIVGEVLIEKYKEGVQPDEKPLPFLETGIGSGINLTDRARVNDLFAVHKSNMENIAGATALKLSLMRGLHEYHLGNMWMNEEKRREGLAMVKATLTPFFDRVADRPAPQKKPSALPGVLKKIFR